MPHTPLDRVALADYSYLGIQKQYIKLLSYEGDVLADKDPEALHQMRVTLRRLRTAMKAYSMVLDLPAAMRDRRLAKIGKVLGKVRDLDVLTVACKDYKAHLPSNEQAYLAELRSSLNKRRDQATFKMRSMMEDKSYHHLKLSINDWLNQPRYQPIGKVALVEILPDLILPAIGQLFQHSAWWLIPEAQESPDLKAEELLLTQGHLFHDLRKQIKYNRYLLELFTDFYSDRYCDFLGDFKQIQKLLGTIQDTLVFNHLLNRMLGKNVHRKMPTFSEQLVGERDRAWQSWQPIQHRYQQLETRQELKLLLMSRNSVLDS
jgi:CHAD domain-containing protein